MFFLDAHPYVNSKTSTVRSSLQLPYALISYTCQPDKCTVHFVFLLDVCMLCAALQKVRRPLLQALNTGDLLATLRTSLLCPCFKPQSSESDDLGRDGVSLDLINGLRLDIANAHFRVVKRSLESMSVLPGVGRLVSISG